MALPTGGYAVADISPPSDALTDFTAIVDLSRLPQAWWDAVDTSDPARGRAAKDTGEAELPCDWIEFDSAAQTGWVRIKWTGTLATTGSQRVRIYPPQAANVGYGPGDPFGQHAAYDDDWAGYWPDGGGQDRTANGNDGTGYGGVEIGGALGPTGRATRFDPPNDHVRVPANGALPLGNSPRTWMAHCHLDTADGRNYIIHLYGPTERNRTYTLRVGDDPIIVSSFYGGDGINASSPPIAGAWHQIVATFSGDSGSLWMDGSALVNNRSLDPTNTDDRDLVIGADADGARSWRGLLSEVQAHTTDRSSAWIVHEYTQTSDQALFWGAWSWESVEDSILSSGALTDATDAVAGYSSVLVRGGGSLQDAQSSIGGQSRSTVTSSGGIMGARDTASGLSSVYVSSSGQLVGALDHLSGSSGTREQEGAGQITDGLDSLSGTGRSHITSEGQIVDSRRDMNGLSRVIVGGAGQVVDGRDTISGVAAGIRHPNVLTVGIESIYTLGVDVQDLYNLTITIED